MLVKSLARFRVAASVSTLCGMVLLLTGCGWVSTRDIRVTTSPVGTVPSETLTISSKEQFYAGVDCVDSVLASHGLTFSHGNYRAGLSQRRCYQQYGRLDLQCCVILEPQQGLIELDIWGPRPFLKPSGTPEFIRECQEICTDLIKHFGVDKVISE